MFLNNLKLFINNIYKNHTIKSLEEIISDVLNKNTHVYIVELNSESNNSITKYFSISVTDISLQIMEITEKAEIDFILDIINGKIKKQTLEKREKKESS
jgi:hypothetical protein